MDERTAWLARRYARYAASGCISCWSNCQCKPSNIPDKEDKRAFMVALKDPNYDTSYYERHLTRMPGSINEL